MAVGKGAQWFHMQTFKSFRSYVLVDPNLGPLRPSGTQQDPPQLPPAPDPHLHHASQAAASKFSTFQKCIEILCLPVVSLLFSSLLWIYVSSETPLLRGSLLGLHLSAAFESPPLLFSSCLPVRLACKKIWGFCIGENLLSYLFIWAAGEREGEDRIQ